MDEYKIKDCSLVYLNEQQMQIRGGLSWKDIYFLGRCLELVIDFIDEYKEEIERGFNKGWRMY